MNFKKKKFYARSLPTILCEREFGKGNTRILEQNVQPVAAFPFETLDERFDRGEVFEVKHPCLDVLAPRLSVDICLRKCSEFRKPKKNQKKNKSRTGELRTTAKRRKEDSRFQVASAFSLLLHVTINFPGVIRAKCLAASRPSPILAPVTMIVFPLISALAREGTFVHWSLMNWWYVSFIEAVML